MAQYHLLTIWRIQAPLSRVYDTVVDSLRWPDWWPGVERVEERFSGGSDGVGNLRHYVWKGSLPYRLCFIASVTRVEAGHLIEAQVEGDLEGTGCWTFFHEDGVTEVRHEWRVRTTRCWMNLFAPVGRNIFARNHGAMMARGAEGLAKAVDGILLFPPDSDLRRPLGHSSALPRFNWLPAATAGLIAGAVATIVQMLLWWVAGRAVWQMLLRDSRLAAGVVLGPSVLPPPVDFEWRIMLCASLVHLFLSASYGLLIAALIGRLKTRSAAAMGGGIGLGLYLVNMYGFTSVFPWFAHSRDWITAAAHFSFGTVAALAYRGITVLAGAEGMDRGRLQSKA